MTTDDFHKHLDICPQCEKNPFDLCPEGHKLLLRAASKPVVSFIDAIAPMRHIRVPKN